MHQQGEESNVIQLFLVYLIYLNILEHPFINHFFLIYFTKKIPFLRKQSYSSSRSSITLLMVYQVKWVDLFGLMKFWQSFPHMGLYLKFSPCHENQHHNHNHNHSSPCNTILLSFHIQPQAYLNSSSLTSIKYYFLYLLIQ